MTAYREDLQRLWDLTNGSVASRVLRCWRNPGLHALACHRFGQWLLGQPGWLRWPLELPYQCWYRHIRTAWGIEIGRGAQIGPGCYIVHFGGIFIGHPVVIGSRAMIMQGVTIGQHGAGAPIIGNYVYLGPGAKLYGPIHIGNNVKIGPNAVVHTDVPDSTVLVAPEPLMCTPRRPLDENHSGRLLHAVPGPHSASRVGDL